MHDLKWIRENPADFDKGLARRGLEPLSPSILKLDEERRTNTTALQEIQARRNAASKEIGKAKGKGGDPAKADALMAEVASLKEKIAAGEQSERELDEKMRDLLASIPNIPAPDVPDGKDEHDNVEVRKWGTPRDMNFEPKQHFELGEALGLMDFEAAAKMSGARFTVLKGPLARLERAIGQFMLDVQTGSMATPRSILLSWSGTTRCSALHNSRNLRKTSFGLCPASFLEKVTATSLRAFAAAVSAWCRRPKCR